MVQITSTGFTVSNPSQIYRMQAEFAEKNGIVIPQLFDNKLIQKIVKNIEAAEFYPHRHYGQDQQEFANDLTMRENELAMHQIHLLLNNQLFFDFIESITGCSPIGSFGGRIYQNLPEKNHQLEWHSDTEQKERLIGISINLSVNPYQGGIFQIRERLSKKITFEVAGKNLGDAHIFRISPELQHRVTSTKGNFARIVAAGWFFSEPDIRTAIKSLFTG